MLFGGQKRVRQIAPPHCGALRLIDLNSVPGKLCLPVERDRHFEADYGARQLAERRPRKRQSKFRSPLVTKSPEAILDAERFGDGTQRARAKDGPSQNLTNADLRVSAAVETAASAHNFSQHSADFSVKDEIRSAIHVGRFAVNNGERSALRLCDHR